MRIPDPKANTTTEAYLAYKAGYLEESELKPVLYEPYLHFDGWLAYWAGLVPMYPIKSPGKNLFNKNDIDIGWNWTGAVQSVCYPYNQPQRTRAVYLLPVEPNTKYTVSLASSDWYVMEIVDVDSNFTILSKSKTTQENAFTATITTGEHFAFLGFKFKYGSAGTTTITEEMLSELKLQVELGDTATAYEDYTGEPEMLTDEEALVAYLSGVTNTYPEEIKDPYDVRIVGYLKYLVSARWGRPEYPVNNEEFYLSTMKPPVVPSGDTPSSDIEMDDTAEAPFIDLKMYGDTSQQTYSGANLYNYTDLSASIGTGITTDDDGWITCTVDNSAGTSTAFSNYYTKPLALSPSTQYVLVIEVLSVSGTGGIEGGGGSSASQVDYYGISFANMTSGSKYILPITSKSDITGANGLRTYFRFNAGQSGSITVRFSVLADTSVTPETFVYQPYTRGIPAPNPDYPQDIDVVTGRQVVGVKGKNLFYGSNNTSGGIVSAWEGSKVTLEGTTTSSYANITGIDPIPTVFEAGTYTFSTDTLTNEYSKVIRIREDGENHDYTIPKGDKSITFTTSGSFTVRICFISGFSQNVGISDTFGLQLELGSEPTAYSPYGGANYEINLGKNLFNTTRYSGNITITGLNSFEANRDTARTANMFFSPRLPAGTYTLSYDISKNSINTYGIACSVYVVNGSSTSSLVSVPQIDGHIEFTFTSPTEVDRLYFYINQNAPSGSTASVSNIQVEVGASATSFAPYFEPIELCKIGDYQDYIYRDGDGDWYVHKAIGKVVFNGSENWNYNNVNQVFGVSLDATFPLRETTNPYCDNYIGQTTATFNQVLNKHISLQSTTTEGSQRILVKDLDIEQSFEGFKAWLSTHNTTLYYPLDIPTDTQITNSELIAQLDALMEGGSYEGKTYIKVTATDPNLPGLLYVEAGKYD